MAWRAQRQRCRAEVVSGTLQRKLSKSGLLGLIVTEVAKQQGLFRVDDAGTPSLVARKTSRDP